MSFVLGAARAHIDTFKRIRDARIDRYVVETNKLLIRLDKLISPEAPTDPSKRKGIFRNFTVIFLRACKNYAVPIDMHYIGPLVHSPLDRNLWFMSCLLFAI